MPSATAPGDRSPLTLEAAAALAGSHCWAERRLFELLGRWSALDRHPPAVLALDRHAQHAAWRAGQWWDRLPVLAQIDRDDLVVPGPAWRALDDPALEGPPAAAGDPALEGSAAGATTPDAGIGRLAVAYRVLLPRLVVAYARHARLTTPAADGPAARTLAQVRADVAADWAEGEAVLQDLLVEGEAVDAAAAAVAAAERLLLPRT